MPRHSSKFNYNHKYYIAGPMTGLPEYNYPAFQAAAEELRQSGIVVASPHEIDHGETIETRGRKPYQEYVNAGLRLLLSCNGIILLNGWGQSKGARLELDVALDLSFPVFYYSNWSLVDMNREINET